MIKKTENIYKQGDSYIVKVTRNGTLHTRRGVDSMEGALAIRLALYEQNPQRPRRAPRPKSSLPANISRRYSSKRRCYTYGIKCLIKGRWFQKSGIETLEEAKNALAEIRECF